MFYMKTKLSTHSGLNLYQYRLRKQTKKSQVQDLKCIWETAYYEVCAKCKRANVAVMDLNRTDQINPFLPFHI